MGNTLFKKAKSARARRGNTVSFGVRGWDPEYSSMECPVVDGRPMHQKAAWVPATVWTGGLVPLRLLSLSGAPGLCGGGHALLKAHFNTYSPPPPVGGNHSLHNLSDVLLGSCSLLAEWFEEGREGGRKELLTLCCHLKTQPRCLVVRGDSKILTPHSPRLNSSK